MGILNVAGYFDPLLALLDHAVAEGFVRKEFLDLLVVSADPEAIVEELAERSSARPTSAEDRFRVEWIVDPDRKRAMGMIGGRIMAMLTTSRCSRASSPSERWTWSCAR